MKSLQKQWATLFSSDSDDQLLNEALGTQNINWSDIFDVSAEIFFANRYPSFNQLESEQNNLISSKSQNEIEDLFSSNSDSDLQIEKFNLSNITIDKEDLQKELADAKISPANEAIEETKI